tara:strand:+ start:90 stop:239 length:150 start_codon:yes stop_codon:yes gene_type:complete
MSELAEYLQPLVDQGIIDSDIRDEILDLAGDPNLTMHIDDDEWEKEMGR